MIDEPKHRNNNYIYLIYDGECLLCRKTAKALRLKEAVGQLITINARSDHPLVTELINKGFDLNEGIIVQYNHVFYYGTDALHLLALLGSSVGLFNKLNAFLFKYKLTTALFYPIFKAIRNLLLRIRGIPKIQKPTQQYPIFREVFGTQWDNLPTLFKKRYGNLAFQDHTITVHGKMNIHVSKIFLYLAPLLRIFGVFLPYAGDNIPVSVEFKSKNDLSMIYMNRTFYFPKKNPYQFNSRLLVSKGEVIELIRFGIGVRTLYRYTDNEIKITHGGYIWRIFTCNIPLPLTILLGKIVGFEAAISDHSFSMLVKIMHSLFGDLFEYNGVFEYNE